MTRRIKIAISVPPDVLDQADRESAARGISRSQLFADAIISLIAHERERDAVARYLRGYSEHPESADDVLFSDELLGEVLDAQDRP